MSDENTAGPSYMVDLDPEGKHGRSVASLIAARKCYTCKQVDDDTPIQSTNAEDHLGQIEEECSGTTDYLLPDTPLKEAVFRVLLAHGNQPMTAQEISEDLSGRWTVSPYPRDVSPPILSRLLESIGGYPISALPEPEEEAEEEVEEEPEALPAAAEAVTDAAGEEDGEDQSEAEEAGSEPPA